MIDQISDAKMRYPRTIMATACIPWTAGFDFDEHLFRREVRYLVDNGLQSIYLFGTAGEGYAVDDDQFRRIVSVFAEEMQKPGLLPMVGIISLSLSQIIERIKWCKDNGMTDFQISFPSWGELKDSEVDKFFDAVLNRFPECRFMHYNNGLRSRKILTFSDYERLWHRYPNLAAVKYPGINPMTDFSALTAENPIRFFPLEKGFEVMHSFNKCGLLISILNLNYRLAHEYFHAGIECDTLRIKNISSQIDQAIDALFDSVPKGLMDGAYDKLYIKKNIPEFPHTLYPPYEAASESQYMDFLSKIDNWGRDKWGRR